VAQRDAGPVITALDTNVIIALWDRDTAFSAAAQNALDRTLQRGGLVVSAAVFAELMAAPGRAEAFLDAFFRDTGIQVDWGPDERVWRVAGRAFQAYVVRRKKKREPGPRRILADFLIGAHALQSRYDLLTLDDRFYKAAFPDLTVMVP
jgi:predicted nucleic acid-binding protein